MKNIIIYTPTDILFKKVLKRIEEKYPEVKWGNDRAKPTTKNKMFSLLKTHWLHGKNSVCLHFKNNTLLVDDCDFYSTSMKYSDIPIISAEKWLEKHKRENK